MTFDDILAQVLDLLQRQGRVSYRAIKRRFNLDDEYLEDLKAELIEEKGKSSTASRGLDARWTKVTDLLMSRVKAGEKAEGTRTSMRTCSHWPRSSRRRAIAFG